MKSPTYKEYLNLFPKVRDAIASCVTINSYYKAYDEVYYLDIEQPLDDSIYYKINRAIVNRLNSIGFNAEFNEGYYDPEEDYGEADDILITSPTHPQSEIRIVISLDTEYDDIYEIQDMDDMRWCRTSFDFKPEYITYLKSSGLSDNDIQDLMNLDYMKDPYYVDWVKFQYPKNNLVIDIQYIIT